MRECATVFEIVVFVTTFSLRGGESSSARGGFGLWKFDQVRSTPGPKSPPFGSGFAGVENIRVNHPRRPHSTTAVVFFPRGHSRSCTFAASTLSAG